MKEDNMKTQVPEMVHPKDMTADELNQSINKGQELVQGILEGMGKSLEQLVSVSVQVGMQRQILEGTLVDTPSANDPGEDDDGPKPVAA